MGKQNTLAGYKPSHRLLGLTPDNSTACSHLIYTTIRQDKKYRNKDGYWFREGVTQEDSGLWTEAHVAACPELNPSGGARSQALVGLHTPQHQPTSTCPDFLPHP